MFNNFNLSTSTLFLSNWYKNEPINPSPAPVVSSTCVFIPGIDAFANFVYASAPSLPFVNMIN